MVTINLNDLVRVKLTESGRRVARDHYEKHKIPAADIEIIIDREKWQLWALMCIFGPECFMGNPKQPFFENNEIAINGHN